MLDLRAIGTPLEPVRFPNGKEFAVRKMDEGAWRLFLENQQKPSDDTAKAMRSRIVPDAMQDDWDSLTTEHYEALLAYAGADRIAALQSLLKNVPAGEVAPPKPSRPSSPRTKGRTSAPKSGESLGGSL